MDDVQWVMASSQASVTLPGDQRVLLEVSQGGLYHMTGVDGWGWSASRHSSGRTGIAVAGGYLSPGDARAAAEAWLATYRAHNEAMAKEGEVAS